MVDIVQSDASLAADYEALLEFLYLTPVGILKFQPNGQILMINPMAVSLLAPLAATTGMSDIFKLFSDVIPHLRRLIDPFQKPSGRVFDPIQISVPGTCAVLTLGVNKVADDTYMGVIQDITLAIEQEKRIRHDQQRFRAIFDNIRGCAICTVDDAGRVEAWNRSLNRLGGWEPADLPGKPIGALFSGGGTGNLDYTALLRQAKLHGSAEAEGWAIRKDGTRFWGHAIGTVLPDCDGSPSGYVVVTGDLTDRKAAEDRLLTLASTDPLTGASNRRAGEARLREAYDRWRRYGRHFALLVIDCDHFKAVNDKWGHDVGDEVLVSLVSLCRQGVRETDVIIRWGGEEFVLLLQETRLEEACVVAERLRQTIEAAKVRHDGESISVTVSIGAAETDNADTCMHDVLNRADRALYQSKAAGRNRVVKG